MDYNGLTLAYIGDAVFEVIVRTFLLEKGIKKVDHLHKEAIKLTSAEGQEKLHLLIEPLLTEEELTIFKRGRNSKTDRKAKNASLSSYRRATGFEALIGYLYLNKQRDRIHALLDSVLEEVL